MARKLLDEPKSELVLVCANAGTTDPFQPAETEPTKNDQISRSMH